MPKQCWDNAKKIKTPFNPIWWDALFFLVLPEHFTQILGHQVSFSQEAEADCGRPSLTASTTEIQSLEKGIFKLSIPILCQIPLKLEAPEEAVFSTTL